MSLEIKIFDFKKMEKKNYLEILHAPSELLVTSLAKQVFLAHFLAMCSSNSEKKITNIFVVSKKIHCYFCNA